MRIFKAPAANTTEQSKEIISGLLNRANDYFSVNGTSTIKNYIPTIVLRNNVILLEYSIMKKRTSSVGDKTAEIVTSLLATLKNFHDSNRQFSSLKTQVARSLVIRIVNLVARNAPPMLAALPEFKKVIASTVSLNTARLVRRQVYQNTGFKTESSLNIHGTWRLDLMYNAYRPQQLDQVIQNVRSKIPAKWMVKSVNYAISEYQ